MAAEKKFGNNEEGNKKAFAILGYVLPILFFLPLLLEATKNDTYARFHANQQLILLIAYVGLSSVLNVFMGTLPFLFSVVQILNVVLIALAIYGIFYAYKGEMKELPLLGQFKIIT